MFDQLSAEIPASLIKGFLRTTTTKQNVDPAVHFVYSRVKIYFIKLKILKYIYLSIKYFFKRLIMHLVLDLYRSSKKSSSTSSSSEVTQTEGLLVYGDPGSLGRSLDELRKSFKIS
jgi:hypothetical protein